MATSYRNKARRELLLAMQAQLQTDCDELLAKVKNPNLKVDARHQAQTQFWLKSGELAMVKRKLKASARAKSSRAKSGRSILSILGL